MKLSQIQIGGIVASVINICAWSTFCYLILSGVIPGRSLYLLIPLAVSVWTFHLWGAVSRSKFKKIKEEYLNAFNYASQIIVFGSVLIAFGIWILGLADCVIACSLILRGYGLSWFIMSFLILIAIFDKNSG